MRLVVSASEAAKMLGISDRTLYSIAKQGKLATVRIGSRVCYRVETLREWLASLEHRRDLPAD
jgi:excisionase family DNA binding protein